MSKPASSRPAAAASLIDIGEVDRFLADNGRFVVLDWLLASGQLAYDDYAAWRETRLDTPGNTLEAVLSLQAARLDQLLKEVDQHARALRLTAEPQQIWPWSSSQTAPLLASARPEVHRRLLQQWRRAADVPQFDLFMDSAPAATEHRLCERLGRHDIEGAMQELSALTRLNAAYPSLASYQDLINYGVHVQQPLPPEPELLRAELDGLEFEVQPLARRLLGARAREYLAAAWQRMAGGLAALRAQADIAAPLDERLHPAYALMQIPDWAAARQSLQSEPGLLEQPHWLALLARACRATGQPEQGCLWAVLCMDRHPQQLAVTLERVADPVLPGLWDEFLAAEDQLQTSLTEAAFAGFVLLRRPGLLPLLDAAPALLQPVNTAMVRLIRARRAGQDEIELRKALASIEPAALALYLRTV